MLVAEYRSTLRRNLNRRRILDDILYHLGTHNSHRFEALVDRFLHSLPESKNLSECVILVPFGGGKDSSFVVTVARLLQLVIGEYSNETFKLRCVTNMQAGMAYGVIPNIYRVYERLGMLDDSNVELLVVSGNSTQAFSADAEIDPTLVESNRTDILMNGHLGRGNNRATFCNTCNFSMIRSFVIGLNHNSGADLVITGDSPREQRLYAIATERMARSVGVSHDKSTTDFARFIKNISGFAAEYYRQVFGKNWDELGKRAFPSLTSEREPGFFSIFDDIEYRAGDHWNILDGLLGFEFHELAFSFTESDCANPALMAHMRGLKAECLWKRDYHEGVAEYRDFAIKLMRKKEFPENLIRMMEDRYCDREAMAIVRSRVAEYANKVLGLSDTQLKCMIFSPFCDAADRLPKYLASQQPQHQHEEPEIRRLLAADTDMNHNDAIVARIEEWSGLPLAKLQRLYSTLSFDLTTKPVGQQAVSPIQIMFLADPHQAEISTQHAPHGPSVFEIESGR